MKCKVTVNPVEITAASSEETLTVGATASDLFSVTPSGKKLAYTSSDETVATVDSDGTVTAVAAGTATITASSKYAEEDATVTVNVKTAILESVTQTEKATLVATFSGDTSAITKDDITITNTYSNKNIAVKSVSVDSTDATKVTITTYAEMTDGKDYTVAYDGVEKAFTATDNTVATVSVSPTTVTCATATEIDAVLYDANGVKLDTVAYGSSSAYGTLDFTINITSGTGHLSGSKLYLAAAGNTAVANVTLHSGEYDSNGVETGNIESGDVTITAVSAATASSWAAKYSKDGAKAYSTVTETVVAAGDTAYAYIQITKSDSSTSTDISAYTFESSDKDVMTVAKYARTDADTILKLTTYKAGSVYIIVKDSDGNVVETLPLTVNAARKAATLTLSSSSATLSNSTAVDDSVTITATVKDQYGESYTKTSYKMTESSGKVAGQSNTTGEFTVSGSGVTAGSYTLKITVTDTADTSVTLTKTFALTVKDAGTTVDDYAISISNLDSSNSVDAIITKAAATELTASFYGLSNGVKSKHYTENVEWTLKDSSGTNKDSWMDQNGGDAVIYVNDPSEGTSLAAGTYTLVGEYTYDVLGDDGVTVTGTVTNTVTTTFVVTNTQPSVTVSVDKTEYTTTSLSDYITVTYDGAEIECGTGTIYYTYTYKDNNGNVSDTLNEGDTNVSSVTITVQVATDAYYQYTATIGKTFTVTAE